MSSGVRGSDEDLCGTSSRKDTARRAGSWAVDLASLLETDRPAGLLANPGRGGSCGAGAAAEEDASGPSTRWSLVGSFGVDVDLGRVFGAVLLGAAVAAGVMDGSAARPTGTLG